MIHLVNLETVRALEAKMDRGATLSPYRFRANIYVDGIGAWEEFGWIGRRIRIGDVELEARCPTTTTQTDHRSHQRYRTPPPLAAGSNHPRLRSGLRVFPAKASLCATGGVPDDSLSGDASRPNLRRA